MSKCTAMIAKKNYRIANNKAVNLVLFIKIGDAIAKKLKIFIKQEEQKVLM